MVTNGGTVTVDSTATLALNSATVTGGIVADNGAIHVTGDSAINAAAVNGGQVTVDATKTLTLDDTTVTDTTITDNGTVKVDAVKTLNLSGVALSGGAIEQPRNPRHHRRQLDQQRRAEQQSTDGGRFHDADAPGRRHGHRRNAQQFRHGEG